MKKTDLEKLNAVRLIDRMKNSRAPDRFGRPVNQGGKAATSPLVEKLLGRQPEAKKPD